MARIRVHDLASELGMSSNKDIIDYLNGRGYDAVTAVSAVPESEVANIRARFGAPETKPAKEAAEAAPAEKADPKPSVGTAAEASSGEGTQKKKSGIVRVFRSQNATRQLQRRPKRQTAPARKAPASAEDRAAGAAGTDEPKISRQDTERAEASLPEKAASPVTPAESAAARNPLGDGAERPARTPASAAAEPQPNARKEDAQAASAGNGTAAEKAPVPSGSGEATEEMKVKAPAERKEAPEASPVSDSAALKSAEASPKASGPKKEAAAGAPKKEEKPAQTSASGDTGFRNGRIIRSFGSAALRNPLGTGRSGAARGQGRGGDRTRGGQGGGYRDRNGQMRNGQAHGAQTGDRGRSGGYRTGGMNGSRAGTGRPFGQGRPVPGAGFGGQAGHRGVSAGRPQGGGDGSLAHKTSRDFRKDGKERERTREERRENGFRGSETGGRGGAQRRSFSRVPKALQNRQPAPQEKKEETVTEITVPEKITVRDLAEKMKIVPAQLVKELFMKGEMVTLNHELTFEKAEEIAMDHNILCEKEEKEDVIGNLLAEDEEDEKDMVPRPPVVCVMGHVDHGKTSLLDAIRHTHVTDREAGGITQHIGAYMVSVKGQKITFLDTPGHEAFTAMRMRGANATDIAVLVVAADDGVMPQTVEAINHAKAANVEIIVAVNKIDKPGANVDRVKQELSEYGLIAEDWGGSTVFCPVSAKTHEGIENLLEMILLTAEMHELKANPNRKARGIVLEAKLDKGRGPVASILIQKGTLHQGDAVACGAAYGKVRAMTDENGKRLHKATPSMPVEITGLSSVPEAGEVLVAFDSEKEARDFAAVFVSEGKKSLIEETRTQMTLDDLYNQIREGKLKELPIVVKADVQGSVEAVSQSLLKLSNDEVVVKVIHGGVGAITESDVSLASASNAIIIGFNVRPDATAKAMAENQKVDIHLYNVIYEAIDDVKRALNGMRAAVYEEKVQGHAEIRQMFHASSVGNIAGAYVKDGIFTRASKVRVFRGEEKLYEGELASLKRFKDDVKEVREGFECGFVFKDWGDFQVDDTVEAYIMVEVPRT